MLRVQQIATEHPSVGIPASRAIFDDEIPLVGASGITWPIRGNQLPCTWVMRRADQKIDLGAPAPVESPFTILPRQTYWPVEPRGNTLFAVDPSGYGPTHYTFGPDGTLVDSVDLERIFPRVRVERRANQKDVLFPRRKSPTYLHWEEIDATGSALCVGTARRYRQTSASRRFHTSDGFLHPIRVAPDGSVVVLGSGVIHELPNARAQHSGPGQCDHRHAPGWKAELYTVRNIAGVVQYQHWALPTYEMRPSLSRIPARPTLC